MSFLNIMLCYYYSLEPAWQSMIKNNPTEKQIDAKSQATLKHAPEWKLTEGKIKSLSLQIAKIDLDYILQLLASEYIFFWIIFCYYSGIRCWLWACICLVGKVYNNHCCCSNPKIHYPANKYLLKVRDRNFNTRC